MSGQLVLLTGATAHVGYRTLIEALSRGHKVRAAVRSESKVSEIKAARSTQSYLNQLAFIIVPNIETDGAFDKAVKGVESIVHVASFLAKPSDDDGANIVRTAIRGTLSILYSALKEPSVKRVVITSSVVAHSASKKLAYKRTREFIASEKPQFMSVNITPTFVIGPNELATTTDAVMCGSNALALGVLFGAKNSHGMPDATVHVDDVAFLHIAALDSKVQGNKNFDANYDVNGMKWDDVPAIVKKHFPTEVERGVFPLGGSQKWLPMPSDGSSTEKFFDFKFKDFETQIKDLAGYYAKLAAATKA